jgi:hypothetical protein
MNIYDIAKIEAELDEIASQNEGEIPDDKYQALVLAETQALEQVKGLVHYVRHEEMRTNNIDSEIERLQTLKNRANNRIKGIKAYLLPFINQTHNGKLEIDTFKLSVRKSEAVEVDEALLDKNYFKEKVTLTPDKIARKEAIKKGVEVNGAYIRQNMSLQIK